MRLLWCMCYTFFEIYKPKGEKTKQKQKQTSSRVMTDPHLLDRVFRPISLYILDTHTFMEP